MRREAAAARAVWPALAKGMPTHVSAALAGEANAANEAATAIPVPPFLAVRHELIGPAERIASLFHSFSLLTQRGFSHIAQTCASLRQGDRRAAKFERGNAGLYIDSVYDGNFDASLIGERVVNSYERLGAAHAFGAALTPAQVSSIASAYSPQVELLSPHLWRELLAQR